MSLLEGKTCDWNGKLAKSIEQWAKGLKTSYDPGHDGGLKVAWSDFFGDLKNQIVKHLAECDQNISSKIEHNNLIVGSAGTASGVVGGMGLLALISKLVTKFR